MKGMFSDGDRLGDILEYLVLQTGQVLAVPLIVNHSLGVYDDWRGDILQGIVLPLLVDQLSRIPSEILIVSFGADLGIGHLDVLLVEEKLMLGGVDHGVGLTTGVLVEVDVDVLLARGVFLRLYLLHLSVVLHCFRLVFLVGVLDFPQNVFVADLLLLSLGGRGALLRDLLVRRCLGSNHYLFDRLRGQGDRRKLFGEEKVLLFEIGLSVILSQRGVECSQILEGHVVRVFGFHHIHLHFLRVFVLTQKLLVVVLEVENLVSLGESLFAERVVLPDHFEQRLSVLVIVDREDLVDFILAHLLGGLLDVSGSVFFHYILRNKNDFILHYTVSGSSQLIGLLNLSLLPTNPSNLSQIY